MPPTDISEKGLETLIVRHMIGTDGLASEPEPGFDEPPEAVAAAKAAGSGWFAGHPKEYDRGHAIDVAQLFRFVRRTQLEKLQKLGIADYRSSKDINRQKFLFRLSSAVAIGVCSPLPLLPPVNSRLGHPLEELRPPVKASVF